VGAAAASTQRLSTTDGLAVQLQRLREVHAALRGRQPERALTLLDQSASSLDAGPFAEEARAARVSALCQLGRGSEARSAFDQFLAAWPRSPLAVRLPEDCSALGGAGKPSTN
jgi:hypothetical protein